MTMIYNQQDYEIEKKLVADKIARNTLKRQYPSKFLEALLPAMEKYYNLYKFEPNLETLSHPKVEEAFKLIEKAHEGQLRKYTNEAYTVHLREVASYLSSLPGHNHEEVIAGLLHDVVEKGNITFDYINSNFGKNVHEHVYFLTDIATPEDGNREARIKKNWEHFSQAPTKTKHIKAIDILSSARTTMLCDSKYGETYMNVIIELMNPYFQKCEDLDSNIKKTFNDMTNLSISIIELQKIYNIAKLEKTYSNKVKNLKKISIA